MKNLLLLGLLSLLHIFPVWAQEKEGDDKTVYTIVEVMPQFPGGDDELYKFLGKHLQYPAEAKKNGIEGVVYVSFVVYEDGTIREAKVLRGIGGGCDAEALRVIRLMPNWEPGTQRGKAVRVHYNLPIRFTLTGKSKKDKKKKKKADKYKMKLD